MQKIFGNRYVLFFIRYILPIVVLGIIVSQLELKEIIDYLAGAKPKYLGLGIFGTFLQFLGYSLRWQIILKYLKIDYPLLKTIRVYLANFFMGTFIPGTFGGLLKVIQLVRDGWRADKGFISVVFEKIYELFFTASFAFGMLLLFPSMSNQSSGNILLSSVLIILVFIGLYIFRKPIWGVINRFILTKLNRGPYKVDTEELKKGITEVTKINHTTILILVSSLVRLGEAVSFYFFAKALSSHVSFLESLLFSAIIALITSLPISFSGIGTRDAALIVMLASIGDANELAIALATVILVSIFFMRLFGFLCWIMDPIKEVNIKAEA